MDWSNLFTLDSAAYNLAQNIFLRALGIIYLVAIFSLLVEVTALYGKNGVAPIEGFLKSRPVFSIFRVCSHDYFIWGLCFLGLPLSILLILGIYSSLCLFLLLLIYLSFVVVEQNFLAFQWDALLVEVSFIAFFFSLSVPASPFLLIALWLLLFRFIFSSGIVKLISGDISWRNLTALKYHYETQPLPNRIAWYMHQLPPLFHQITAGLMFGIELIIPFLILGPHDLKLVAFVAIVVFQVSLIFSGNFSFLNYLTIVLCLPLLSNADYTWFNPYFIIIPSNH
ncbi:MAG: lipase maturation factor family protein, partial [bacterium]|nr:lipase maturation factor family protein [bacterium]